MSSIKKQGIQNTIITYAGVILGFVSLMFIQPHLLSSTELGLVRIMIAAASLIAALLPLGVSSVTVKYFPYFRDQKKKHHGFLGFVLLFPLTGLIICGILVYIFKGLIIAQYTNESALFIRYFDLVLPLAFFISLNMTLNAYCVSLFRTTISVLFEGIIMRILYLVLILIYYYGWIDLTQFMYLLIGNQVIQSVSLIIYIYTIDSPGLKMDGSFFRSVGLRQIIRFGLLLTLTNISSVSLKGLDVVLIGKYMDLDFVAVFSIAAFISIIIEIPLTSLERITHGKVSHAWANNDVESIRKIYYQSVKYLMLLGGLLLIGIIANIHDLLSLLPAIYQKGSTVAVIACIGTFLNIATGVNTSILFSSEKYIYGTFLLIFLLVLALILNIVLIPVYGIEGAAIATAGSSVIYNILKYFIIWKNFKMQPYDLSSVKILLVIGIVFLISCFLPVLSNAVVSMIVRSAVITISYIILTYVLKIVPEFHKYLQPFKN